MTRSGPTNPEFANAVEIGSKIEALDSRVRFNTAVFYVKYKDAQRALNSTVTNAQGVQFQQTLFFNAANATVKGIELEVLTRPVAALTFGANYTYQKAKYDKFQANTDFNDTTTCATCDPGNDIDLSGLPITRAPKHKARRVRDLHVADGQRCVARAQWQRRVRVEEHLLLLGRRAAVRCVPRCEDAV